MRDFKKLWCNGKTAILPQMLQNVQSTETKTHHSVSATYSSKLHSDHFWFCCKLGLSWNSELWGKNQKPLSAGICSFGILCCLYTHRKPRSCKVNLSQSNCLGRQESGHAVSLSQPFFAKLTVNCIIFSYKSEACWGGLAHFLRPGRHYNIKGCRQGSNNLDASDNHGQTAIAFYRLSPLTALWIAAMLSPNFSSLLLLHLCSQSWHGSHRIQVTQRTLHWFSTLGSTPLSHIDNCPVWNNQASGYKSRKKKAFIL